MLHTQSLGSLTEEKKIADLLQFTQKINEISDLNNIRATKLIKFHFHAFEFYR